MFARGVSPWGREATQPQAPKGRQNRAARNPSPAAHCRPYRGSQKREARRWVQGLTPLANHFRPSGAGKRDRVFVAAEILLRRQENKRE